ncbi:DinB family protein [Nonomuraea sp. NPDC050383]|uniref:DinB family protein n=1 Tax=Nonomuraea sp. NPDC050383 TaxID=3364362 RepID=UPI0037B2CCAD
MADNRVDPPLAADERVTLSTFLDWQRDTLTLKCEGLTDEQLRLPAVEPSGMSLLGLVRHLAHVERAWFRHVLCDEDVPLLWGKETNRDADFENVDDTSAEEAFAIWRAEVEHAREVSAGLPLDALGKRLRHGERFSHRWILVHMIEEYARHNGHADLLRERIDGTTGE